MNKQELIEELECIEVSTASLDYLKGADYANERAINLAKQLKESKKAVLPKIADEFIKEGLSMGSDKVDIIGSAVSFSSAMPTAEFSKWFKTNGDLLIDALANGYEVEKEQLYYVKFDILYLQKYLVKNVETNQFYLSNNEKVVGNYEQVKFTEQEIKSIDERYWPFAVKVEG
ncbi:DUF1642 domain-containing protein [Enterococcus faecalis]|uniref:DUF1642 domain-containing protein n=1 Tax=Enterococcus faecalis TaxID=1351 RepID=UPI00115AE192|nr:DUF1642 domain-containing protein [Enterococcus faecalis]HCT1442297.1 DUF1642 domain-containing protein [Enterococcus faecalis]